MQDDDSNYHASGAYVYIANLAILESEIWSGVDYAEAAGISLEAITTALRDNRDAAIVALARKNLAVLRAIIDEAGTAS
jgi:hypothetical protein